MFQTVATFRLTVPLEIWDCLPEDAPAGALSLSGRVALKVPPPHAVRDETFILNLAIFPDWSRFGIRGPLVTVDG
jgi:hypothetical protein